MWIKKRLGFLDSIEETELTGEGLVEFETKRQNSITDLTIYGITTSWTKLTYPYRNSIYHVGYLQNSDSKIYLNLRSHGRNYLDGYEMERIMLDCGANFYKGQYDETSMMVKNGVGLSSSLVPFTHIKFKEKTSYTFRFNAYADGILGPYTDKFYTFMNFYHHNNSAKVIIHPENKGGDFTVTSSSNGDYTLTQIRHKRDLAYDYSYLIRYAGMSLTEWMPGENEVVEPYVGYNQKLAIPGNAFLEGVTDTEDGEFIADEYYPFAGMVERKFHRFVSAPTDVMAVTINGNTVYAFKLPKKANPRRLMHSNTFNVSKDVNAVAANDNYTCISEDCEYVYLKTPATVTSVEGAISYWNNANTETVFLMDEFLTQRNDDKYVCRQPAGFTIFSVCGYGYPKIKLTHI